jgi:hypothetical protein
MDEAPEVLFDPDNFEPIHYGPTWERNPETGKFLLPERTLGEECLIWCHRYLRNPETGGPWVFTKEQARFVLWWYALDENDKFSYRRGTMRRMKGHGKDPIAACLAAFELCGNCRYSHTNPVTGKIVGKRPAEPWVIIAAVNLAQTQTTAKLFEVMFNDAARKQYRLKIGAEQVLADGGIGKIQCVTSSPGMLESFRPSFIIANEVHHWLAANDGHEMAKVLRRIAGKKDSRVLSLTNAYQPGMDSVGQQDWEGYLDFLSGRAMDTGVLYDSLEAPPEAPLSDPETIAKVLMKVRGDSVWFPVDRIVQEILDPQTAVSESRRFYYNQIVSLEDALVAEGEWAPCRDNVTLNDGDEIVLGLDGGKTDDSTVLVALRLSDRAFFRLHSQEKPRSTEVPQGTKWTADLERVDGAVANAFGRYQVRAFFSDVHPLESYVDKWSNDYRDVLMIKAAPGKSTVGFDMRGNQQEITRMNMSLVENIRSRAIKHPGDPVLTQHVLNCYQRQNAWGVIFGKESRESERKVDAYAAMLLAFIAMNKYLESGKRPEKPQGKRGWIF